MKNLTDQLANYAAYHRDRRNIATHLVGVPMIVFGVVTLMARPVIEVAGLPVTPAIAALIAAGIYYLLLDFALGIGLVVVIGAMAWVGQIVAAASTPTWLMVGVGMFVVGWIIQFIGHYYEGRKPAFVGRYPGPLDRAIVRAGRGGVHAGRSICAQGRHRSACRIGRLA